MSTPNTAPGTLQSETIVGDVAVQVRNIYAGRSVRVSVVLSKGDGWAILGSYPNKDKAKGAVAELLLDLILAK